MMTEWNSLRNENDRRSRHSVLAIESITRNHDCQCGNPLLKRSKMTDIIQTKRYPRTLLNKGIEWTKACKIKWGLVLMIIIMMMMMMMMQWNDCWCSVNFVHTITIACHLKQGIEAWEKESQLSTPHPSTFNDSDFQAIQWPFFI